MVGMEIMSCIERRRRWSDEAKLRILAEGDEPGARIGDVARQHDIHPGQIRLWRQSFSHADFGFDVHNRGRFRSWIQLQK